MPAQGTPEYFTEVAKMAAVENSLRQSSSKRRGKAVDGTSDKTTMNTPSEGTLGVSPPPASASADTVPESEGTLGMTPPPASDQADASTDTVPESKGTLGVTSPPASVQTAIANEDPRSAAAVQLESLSERITIVEQLCDQLGESTDKMSDFDAHVRYVVNTFERTQKAFERTDKLIGDVQAETSRMAEVLVELRSDHLADLDRHAHLQDVIKHYVDPRILELAMTQRGQHAELVKRVSHLEKDTVVELNVLQSRIHALETRRHVQPTDHDTVDARATDNEMINAQLSAL
jgi:uncharacterized phage infection (PIP) family protein YhgE